MQVLRLYAWIDPESLWPNCKASFFRVNVRCEPVVVLRTQDVIWQIVPALLFHLHLMPYYLKAHIAAHFSSYPLAPRSLELPLWNSLYCLSYFLQAHLRRLSVSLTRLSTQTLWQENLSTSLWLLIVCLFIPLIHEHTILKSSCVDSGINPVNFVTLFLGLQSGGDPSNQVLGTELKTIFQPTLDGSAIAQIVVALTVPSSVSGLVNVTCGTFFTIGVRSVYSWEGLLSNCSLLAWQPCRFTGHQNSFQLCLITRLSKNAECNRPKFDRIYLNKNFPCHNNNHFSLHW